MRRLAAVAAILGAVALQVEAQPQPPSGRAAIAGRVTDAFGDPAINVVVSVESRSPASARAAALAETADRGEYRLGRLPAGRYVVSVFRIDTIAMNPTAPSYFPGTPQPSAAQFVSIAAAQNVDGIDIGLARARTFRVAGTVLSPAGGPTNPGGLSLVSSVRSASPVGIAMGGRLAPDGSFEFHNVPPGQYVIRADRSRSQPWIEGDFGTLPIVVDGADVTGLVVHTSSGSSVAGRFTFLARENTKPPAPSGVELRPLAVDFDAAPASVATATIRDDWTFEMAGLNGPRRLELTRVPAGWSLQEIRVRGVDVTDRPLPFGRSEQSLAGVEVILTDRLSELSGTIADAERPQPGAIAIAFAADRTRWYPGSRYVRRTTAASDGAFAIAGLAFGSYDVAAVAPARLPADGDDWQDPAFLDTLVARAVSVTVAEGQRQVVRLTAPP